MIQMGCGSTETGTLLTYLDLPNAHTFHRISFSRILLAMRPKIKNITNLCMQEGRDEEIRETIGEESYQKYKEGKLNPEEVSLIVMYDYMGWNKRSSGNKYIMRLTNYTIQNQTSGTVYAAAHIQYSGLYSTPYHTPP